MQTLNEFIKGGDRWYSIGRYKDALICYNMGLKKDKNNIILLTKKGNTLYNLHNTSKAYECYFYALINAKAIDLIDQYMTQYNSDLQMNLVKLQELLNCNYNIPITKDGLQMFLKETQKELDERRRIKEWKQFKKWLQQKHLKSPEEYVDIFLKHYGEQYHKHFLSFYCYLWEEGILNINMPQLFDIIMKQIKKIELKKFERFLKSGKKLETLDKMTGLQFEKYLTMFFETCGYQVNRTQQTRDQGADILLKRFGETIVVQAKRQKQTVGNKAIQEVYAAQKLYFAHKAIVITTSNFTKPAIQLADRLGVETWDRKRLIKEIRNL